jgi:hypothetical protein
MQIGALIALFRGGTLRLLASISSVFQPRLARSRRARVAISAPLSLTRTSEFLSLMNPLLAQMLGESASVEIQANDWFLKGINMGRWLTAPFHGARQLQTAVAPLIDHAFGSKGIRLAETRLRGWGGRTRTRKCVREIRPVALRPHFVHDVVLARVLNHL